MPGVVEILAVMSLEKPQAMPGKPKTLVLDAGIWWKPDSAPILATLRYYNDSGAVFNDSGSLFYVLAKVVKMNKTTVGANADMPSSMEYILMGDIIHLFSLTALPPDSVYDPNANAVVRVSGPVDSVDSSTYTFKMTIAQYTSYTPRGIFPAKIVIPAESKWKNDRIRALPKPPRVVTLSGILTSLPSSDEPNEDFFGISVTRDLEFVGTPDPGAVITALNAASANTRGTGLQFMQQLNLPTTSPSSTTSSAPSGSQSQEVAVAEAPTHSTRKRVKLIQ